MEQPPGGLQSRTGPLSHQHPVDGLGLDGRFCHTTVEVSDNAGTPRPILHDMPLADLTNAAILAPGRDSLASNTSIVWHRINDLPDYVYFNMRSHRQRRWLRRLPRTAR